MLGKVENAYKRFGLGKHLLEFCAGLGPYLMKHQTNITGFIHPTHKTEEEKRIARNKKAVKRYAARKAVSK